MSELPSGDILAMFEQFKDSAEKQAYLSAQHKTISALLEKNQQQELEIEHLKSLLSAQVGTFIISPEEALIESQIKIIQNRSFGQELDLEDVKKLDLLLKNKNLIKSIDKAIGTTATKFALPQKELLVLAKSDGSK